MSKTLFDSTTLGDIALANRVVMAPLTRNRADNATDEVGEMHVDYYRQRAGAGLIITEATQISPEGKGYLSAPGIYTEGQVAAWKKVTDAVHEAGGKIVLQLWHVRRISHTSLQPDGQQPVAPSAIRADAKTFVESGFVDTSEPRALADYDRRQCKRRRSLLHHRRWHINWEQRTHRRHEPYKIRRTRQLHLLYRKKAGL